MRKIVVLMLVLAMVLAPAAMAYNPARFEGVEGMTVSYDPENPLSYTVKAGFAEADGWTQFGGHLVVRYMNAGKDEELPLILAAFTTSGKKAEKMTVRTDAHQYDVVCTDLEGAGLASVSTEATLLVTEDSVEMLKDIAQSAYTRIGISGEKGKDVFEFTVSAQVREMLNLFLEEYEEQVAPMLASSVNMQAVYGVLNPVVNAEAAAPIGEAALEIQNTEYPTLQNGSQGEEVQKLQEALKQLGFLSSKADGIFGGRTAKAVKAFQESVGMNRSGVADDVTQTALYLELLEAAE